MRWRFIPILVIGLLSFSGIQKPDFTAHWKAFAEGYQALEIPDLTLGYKEYFEHIPGAGKLQAQQAFFQKQKDALTAFDRTKLKGEDKTRYDQLQYEIDFNFERLALETAWVRESRQIPAGGLYGLKDREQWYRHFVQKFTTLTWTPEQIAQFGYSEVVRSKQNIRRIRLQLGFPDSLAFLQHLKADSFYLTDKAAIVRAFEATGKTVKAHLPAFAGIAAVPPIYAMEWPDADANTPPGMYLPRERNPYGKDIFQYNFYGSRFNRRVLEWIFMHEAVPGHHLQFSTRYLHPEDALQKLFMYPGNFEGWACYVEYFGKDLGLYSDPYCELGKWEWDLVRSGRLVLDVGIHAQGWTHERALAWWRDNIPGQDEIAEREVTRVTNWPAQALSYKMGADCIFQIRKMVQARQGKAFSQAAFHKAFLEQGMRPLPVLEVAMGAK